MNDPVLRGFLEQQYADAMALAGRSDLLDLEPVGPKPVQLYVAHFTAKGLVRRGADVVEADRLDVGIHFGKNYLRHANPAEVLTLFAPAEVWHPNLRMPYVCPGWLRAGTGLVDLLYQVFDIWTYKRVTPNEFDSLNPAACSWARVNRDRFPIDPRPLCRQSLQ